MTDGLRVNDSIDAARVRLIDGGGENRGIVSLAAAQEAAQAADLDLVEIAPDSAPPVCKLLDYGKYKYRAQKKASETRKRQKVIEVKEIKMRPNIDRHDYEVKLRNLHRFIEEGAKVKLTLRFRGREMAHTELGSALLARVREAAQEAAKVEVEPKLEGRQMVMVFAPRGRTEKPGRAAGLQSAEKGV